ncbi:uncharacterized protein LOC119664351 [Teleopsis dalmanni]|uniref:uncharacterized protein LOC119664351 n=1 Tax=Teleopsis dalmanni TaxID=139649 RepID=UPI0018CE4061|nr:uncharacterized protein LOC119664351 [Teleopsis dalmanni]
MMSSSKKIPKNKFKKNYLNQDLCDSCRLAINNAHTIWCPNNYLRDTHFETSSTDKGPNPYINFLKDYKREHKDLTTKETIRLGAHKWNNLHADDKLIYMQDAFYGSLKKKYNMQLNNLIKMTESDTEFYGIDTKSRIFPGRGRSSTCICQHKSTSKHSSVIKRNLATKRSRPLKRNSVAKRKSPARRK